MPGKILFSIILQRLHEAMDSQLREEQAGCRKDRSCCEQNFIEQCRQFQKPLYINFIDFKKALDTVPRESKWKIAHIYGIPYTFSNIFKSMYQNSTCCIKTEDSLTCYFSIETGVRQGCILSPFLFIITLDFIMKNQQIK